MNNRNFSVSHAWVTAVVHKSKSVWTGRESTESTISNLKKNSFFGSVNSEIFGTGDVTGS